MQAGYIAGYVIFYAVIVTVAVFMYAYNTYTKNRLFSKAKISALVVVIFSLLAACFAAVGGYFIWHMTSPDAEQTDVLHIVLCFILVGFCLAYLVAFIVITINNNKNKIDYKNISQIDWKAKIQELEKEIGDVEKLRLTLANKHKKYYQQMLTYYETILTNAKKPDVTAANKIADLITFNDAFSHKWSKKLNRYQLLLTYRFCEIF